MDWFPRWLDGIKSALTFARQCSVEIVRNFREAGLSAVAEIVDALSLPYFAQWRWGALHEVRGSLKGVIGILQRHWGHMSFLKKVRDTSLIRR
eukprot:7857321-Pyramimonas_sp.AAC.1